MRRLLWEIRWRLFYSRRLYNDSIDIMAHYAREDFALETAIRELYGPEAAREAKAVRGRIRESWGYDSTPAVDTAF